MWFLAQRARLRGTEPSGDLFGDLEPGHQLLKTDPRRPLDANLKALTDLIEPSDTIVDVGGGAGRMSLPLALRCHSVTNISQRDSHGSQVSRLEPRPSKGCMPRPSRQHMLLSHFAR